MLGVVVKPLLAAIGVKIIHLALVLAGSAGLFGRLLCHFQAAYRVFGVGCGGPVLETPGSVWAFWCT